ncbi:MAG: response regulator [Bacteroidota bacterium]|nr:response regulator [Bacteroidota bacterium]
MAQKLYKILIVDDDKAFLIMITALLTSIHNHLSIEVARSGKECLQKVKSFSPNLVLLDIGMDGMNGLVTLRFIKSMDKTALVFFLSGHSVEYIKEVVGMVHVDGYYTKMQFLDVLKNKQSLDDILNEGKVNT